MMDLCEYNFRNSRLNTPLADKQPTGRALATGELALVRQHRKAGKFSSKWRDPVRVTRVLDSMIEAEGRSRPVALQHAKRIYEAPDGSADS
jgi:hypothetical protein